MAHKVSFIVCTVILVAIYCLWAIFKPLPELRPVISWQAPPPRNSNVLGVQWPPGIDAALGSETSGVLLTHSDQKARPIASVSKVMLALAILDKKPFKPGMGGETVPITHRDELTYKQYLVSNQSTVAVKAGVNLTEYQALEGLLIASGNNLATTLANWGFGSIENYLTYVNSYAQVLGLNHTHFADASGFSSQTVSTPSDLVSLGILGMANPVIAQIVSQSSAVLPVAGKIHNYNSQLGNSVGIDGIKTGNTNQAGGCFLFSSKLDGFTLVGAIMRAPDLKIALAQGTQLMDDFKRNVQIDSVVGIGQLVGYYNVRWQGRVSIKASQSNTFVDLVGTQQKPSTEAFNLRIPAQANQEVGQMRLRYGGQTQTARLTLSQNINQPSIWWRLTHPL